MNVRGKTIVLAGRFYDLGERQGEMKRRLEELGARVTGSVTSRTDLVFAAPYAEGRNMAEARSRGLPIFNDDALRHLLADAGDSDAPDAPDAPDDAEGDGRAASDLVALRARLLKLEREQGITEEHRAATREILAMDGVRLLHPYGHQVEVNDYALSPCGRYLATGTWLGDHAPGGTLQIWELASGRCVGYRHAMGGVGWPGHERSIQWSADGRRIGLVYRTNRIGVFDPFDPGRFFATGAVDLLAYAAVADDAPRPPVWALAPDGKRAFVASESPCEVSGCVIPLERGKLSWTPGEASPSKSFLLAERLPEELRTAEMDERDDVVLRADQVRWSRDGTRVQAQGDGRGRREAFVVDAASGQVNWVAVVGELAAWSPDDRLLAHYRDGLRFLDAATGKPAGKPDGKEVGNAAGGKGVSALQWGMRGAVPRLAALVGEGNADGARPGVLIYDEDRFRFRLDVTPVEDDLVFADSWAWSPSGDAGAWLTADGCVEVWSLDGDQPRRLRTLDVPPETGVLLWGADDVLVALSPTTLRFLRAGSGDVLGDFTFLRTPPGPRPLGEAWWWFERRYFAPDDTTWCAAFEEGVVIAPDGRGVESLDDVLAWPVRERVAWPVRWGGLRVASDARTAGHLLGDRGDGPWLHSYVGEIEKELRQDTSWPPRRTATVEHLVPTATSRTSWGMGSPQDPRVSRDLRYAARLCARRGAAGLATDVLKQIEGPGEKVAAAAEVAMILARAGRPDEARGAFAVPRRRHIAPHAEVHPWESHETAFVAAAVGGAYEALGDPSAADAWFARARGAIDPEDAPWHNRLAVIWALTECGREEEARALWGPDAWDAAPEPDPSVAEPWLAYLLGTRRYGLYDAFLAAWEAAAGRRQADPGVARPLTRYARKAIAASGDATPYLTPLSPTTSDLAELTAEYDELQKIPRSHRAEPTRRLIRHAARCGHLAAVIDLLGRLPETTDYDNRPQALFTALWLATTGRISAPW
ncbi:BRCT domain-containing protein [Streptomyces sp. NPDC101227]|uniref:BRCT domain-containing protein n=1 Tax=Streptomyces sp. NPDC101227 TaxID=3366136 RepID=UPI00382FC82A